MRSRFGIHAAVAAVFALVGLVIESGCNGQNCSSGSGPSVCIGGSSFNAGDTITADFAGGPGEPKDWIAVYPAGACDATCPPGSTLWKYCATNTHTATSSGVASGSVVIDSTANGSNWPLGGGDYEMLYLVNDGYTPIARVSFHVSGPSGGGNGGGSVCTERKAGEPCEWPSDCCSDACDFTSNTCD